MRSRRKFLKSTIAATMSSQILFGNLCESSQADSGQMIFIFLRGGLDALALASPKGKDLNYLKLNRPHLMISKPYGFSPYLDLHPNLANTLKSDPILFKNFNIIIHAGSINPTRSHFEQMARVEHGDMYSTPPDGILGRAARLLNRETFAIGNNIPVSLKGTNALVVTDANSLREDYSHYPIKNGAFFNRNQRLAMYRQAEGENGDSKVNHYAESALAQYSKLNEGGAITEPHLSDFGYLNTQFGKRLALSTSLLCSPANPLFITVDAEHDWDTHSNQRVNSTEEEDSFGWNINDISRNLLALKKDLEARKKWNTTSVFVISEFGRTIKENGARGSDHGWGGAILLMGGRIRSHADVNFKGLRSWQLPRHTNSSTAIDVKHDYRVILAEVLQKNCGFSQNKIASIFLNQVSTKDYISVCT